MNRIVGVLGAAALLGGVVGCGGGGGGSSSTATTTAPHRTQDPAALVRQDWIAFFDPSTPAARKVALLQNGERFAQVIQAQQGSPLARGVSARVSSVTLQGPNRARVVYTILLAGKPVLQNRTGTAVLQNGTWKVGDVSFCQLLGLQGAAPAVCPKG